MVGWPLLSHTLLLKFVKFHRHCILQLYSRSSRLLVCPSFLLGSYKKYEKFMPFSYFHFRCSRWSVCLSFLPYSYKKYSLSSTFKQEEFTPVKWFSIDRVFRNETLDATHLAEFHQIEGVVADYDLTLGHLMGMLYEFFKKLGLKSLMHCVNVCQKWALIGKVREV